MSTNVNEHLLVEHTATRLLGLSFDSHASPSFRFSPQVGAGAAFGWGFAWYPKDSSAAHLLKDPTSLGDNAITAALRSWERFDSSTFVCHLRGGARALGERDTHPFRRAFGGRDWVFAHNGDLFGDLERSVPISDHPALMPLGRSDSERAFCWLLHQMHQAGFKRLSDVGWPRLYEWLHELDILGSANFLLTDGLDLIAYRDDEGYNGLSTARLLPPHQAALVGDGLHISLDDASARSRTMIVFATLPLATQGRLSAESRFLELERGQMLVARRGAYVWSSTGPIEQWLERFSIEPERPSRISLLTPLPPSVLQRESSTDVRQSSRDLSTLLTDAEISPTLPQTPHLELPSETRSKPGTRLLSLVHETTYHYSTPIELSRHVYRLRPVHDLGQELIAYDLSVDPETPRHHYDDVFGNGTDRSTIELPYSSLRIVSRAIVRVVEPQHGLRSPERRVDMPLVWMPWQRQMMSPYLLPPELPETQLQELSEFAMSFVRRQDNDLVRMLLDLNSTIYRDFAYQSNSTTLETTPFEVYAKRRGVCQDFANLFICLARLLSIPARYRVGYIYTGVGHENTLQSEASHAWVEAYLPNLGWVGFDPTNGCLAGTDHIRVACGRNYRDATPTSGTIYRGGGGHETLEVRVRVERLD